MLSLLRDLVPTPARQPRLLVLVLPGGTDDSHRPFRPWQGSALRMYPFTASIAARFPRSVRVSQASYQVYGWNGEEASPLPYAWRALDRLSDEYPGVPVAVIGHSMGGRIGAALAADERVTDLLALAPWWQFADWRLIRDDVRVVAMHGDADTVTYASRTAKGIVELQQRGVDATYIPIPGGGHPMLDNVGRWQGAALDFVAEALRRDRQISAGPTP